MSQMVELTDVLDRTEAELKYSGTGRPASGDGPALLTHRAGSRTIAGTMPRWAVAEGVNEHVVGEEGHQVTQDAPEAVAIIIENFLDDLRSTRWGSDS